MVFFWITLGLAFFLAVLGSMYYMMLRFKKRVDELERQLQVSMAKKLDAMVLVVKQIDDALADDLGISKVMIKQWASKVQSTQPLTNQVVLSREVSAILISLKNKIKNKENLQPMALVLEEVESEFRRLLLIYNNEAKALNGMIDHFLFKGFVMMLRLQKVVTFDLT